MTYELLAVSGRLAILQGIQGSRFNLHLLDLTAGKDVTIAANGSRGIVTGSGPAAISPRGLVYSVNTYPGKRHPHAKLVFVPTAKLLASLNQ